jgi:hypothetical protein
MSIIQKQLILNQLVGLTEEIIEIIKEFAFYNLIKKTRNNKNKIIFLINNTLYSPYHCRPLLEENIYLFWIHENENSPQFQNTFCTKCGNYVILYQINPNIICRCTNDN